MIDVARSKFELFEREKKLFTTMLKHHTENQLHFQPATGEWSMLEVAQHLMIVERDWLQQIQAIEFAKPTLLARFKMFTICLVLKSGYRARLAKNPAPPSETLSFEQVTVRWDQLHSDWKAKLETMTPTEFTHITINHPLSGVIVLGQAIDFMVVHAAHHRDQLERIRKAPGFPKI